MINVVELLGDPNDGGMDQPCRFGNRVESHAVYCHNESWSDSPRKCRRTWYTGGKVPDEECPGYELNAAFKGEAKIPKIVAPCSHCNGTRRSKEQHGRYTTCPHCDGNGSEPAPEALDEHEMFVLESIFLHGQSMFLAQDENQRQAADRVVQRDLADLHQVSWAKDSTGYLLEITGLGKVSVRAEWNRRKLSPPPSP